VLPISFLSEILPKRAHYHVLNSLNVEEIRYNIKKHLRYIKKEIAGINTVESAFFTQADYKVHSSRRDSLSAVASEQSKNMNLIISGKTLEIIFNDTQYLKQHFAFVAHFCDALIAFDCDDKIKYQLIKLVKNKLRDDVKTISIGNNYACKRAADISIGV